MCNEVFNASSKLYCLNRGPRHFSEYLSEKWSVGKVRQGREREERERAILLMVKPIQYQLHSCMFNGPISINNCLITTAESLLLRHKETFINIWANYIVTEEYHPGPAFCFDCITMKEIEHTLRPLEMSTITKLKSKRAKSTFFYWTHFKLVVGEFVTQRLCNRANS